MGEAKRKRMALEAGNFNQQSDPEIEQIDVAKVCAAVHQVVSAITDYHGADCLLYAHVGAELLRSLGLDAKLVAGSAIWRVGAGDSDVVSHAYEVNGVQYSQVEGSNAALFHSWIEAPGLIIDFSTSTLRNKAQQLDAADGGFTKVDWCPDFIWHHLGKHVNPKFRLPSNKQVGNSIRTPKAVLMAADAGVFNYTRHVEIESTLQVAINDLESSLGPSVFAAKSAYSALCRGERINIIGVSPDGTFQETPSEAVLRPRITL